MNQAAILESFEYISSVNPAEMMESLTDYSDTLIREIKEILHVAAGARSDPANSAMAILRHYVVNFSRAPDRIKRVQALLTIFALIVAAIAGIWMGLTINLQHAGMPAVLAVILSAFVSYCLIALKYCVKQMIEDLQREHVFIDTLKNLRFSRAEWNFMHLLLDYPLIDAGHLQARLPEHLRHFRTAIRLLSEENNFRIPDELISLT